MEEYESPTESQPSKSQPTESQPSQSQPTEPQATEAPPTTRIEAPTEAVAYSKSADEPKSEVIAPRRPWWRRPGVLGLIAGGVALLTAIALVVVLVVLPDSSKQDRKS